MSQSAHADDAGKPIAPGPTPLPLPSRTHGDLCFTAMINDDLPEVEAVERDVYQHPWTMGNFIDSLASGYETRVVRNGAGVLVGYFLLLLAPDDAHLLNITVRRAFQGRGIGRLLLDQACLVGRLKSVTAILLEVRPSNPHALAVYRHVGFQQIGLRKGYYPAVNQQREDAIVMRLAL